jgi:hypothetical protein
MYHFIPKAAADFLWGPLRSTFSIPYFSFESPANATLISRVSFRFELYKTASGWRKSKLKEFLMRFDRLHSKDE